MNANTNTQILLIHSLQEAYRRAKIIGDSSTYEHMLESEYIKALEGKFDLNKIYFTKDGRFKVFKPIQVCRKNKIDVLKALYRYFYEDSKMFTLEVLYKKWMVEFEEDAKQEHRSWDTVDKYKSDWVRFLENSDIAQMDITKIKVSTLRKFYKSISANGAISRKTLSNTKSLINHIFDYAVDNDIITQNLARQTNTRDLRCKEVNNNDKVYSDAEREAVLSVAEQSGLDNCYVYAIIVMFCTCARVGEIEALKWSDIDFKERTIHIHSSMHRTRDENGKQVYFWGDFTKGHSSAGNRFQPIADRAFRALKKQRLQNPFGEYVFMENGHAMLTTQFNRWLKRFCTKAGVEYLSSHKIRFTAVTKMITAGMDVREVQYSAGHKDVGTTLDYFRNKQKVAVGADVWNSTFN